LTRDQSFFNSSSLLIGALTLVAVAIFVMAVKMTFLSNGDYDPDSEEYLAAVADRIRPLGSVLLPGQEAQAAGPTVPEAVPAAPVATSMTGPQAYNAACITCHGSGIGGAPIVADTAAWTERVAQGSDTLYDHAINGFTGAAGFMPQKGGRLDLSDQEVRDAVDYMVTESR
jgi:cytochrome c5